MQEKFVKFPKIFRLDSMEFTPQGKCSLFGSIKLHGTNAAIGCSKDQKVWVQGRNRQLTPDMHSYGFAEFALSEEMQTWIKQQRALYHCPKHLDFIVFGEWCGEKIQAKVAVSKVTRFFAPFIVAFYNPERAKIEKFDSVILIENNETLRIFPTKFEYTAQVDFNNAEDVRAFEDFANAKVQEIETEDPFAKTNFDISGVGEGIVWYVRTERGLEPFIKSKGDAHKKTKVEKILSQDEIVKLQAKEKALEWFKTKVTERRIEQAFEFFQEFGIGKTKENGKHFIKWIVQDVLTEEKPEMLKLDLTEDLVKSVAGKVLWKLYFEEILKS